MLEVGMRVLAFDEGSHQKRKIYLVSSVCLETPKTPECDSNPVLTKPLQLPRIPPKLTAHMQRMKKIMTEYVSEERAQAILGELDLLFECKLERENPV